jgi:hypothetical protein
MPRIEAVLHLKTDGIRRLVTATRRDRHDAADLEF